jgi:hypothetical protein
MIWPLTEVDVSAGPGEKRDDMPEAKPSTELVLAMSCTRRASKSFGLTKFSALESLIAMSCVNLSSPGGGEAILMEEEAMRGMRWWYEGKVR